MTGRDRVPGRRVPHRSSSRLIPDRDGGYALATLARARQMAAAGVHEAGAAAADASTPAPPAEHARHRATFAGRDLVVDPARMRNLFDEAGRPARGCGGVAARRRAPRRAGPGARVPRDRGRRGGDASLGAAGHRGRPRLAHHDRARSSVYDRRGSTAGVLDGFGALYRAWLAHVVDGSRRATPTARSSSSASRASSASCSSGWDDPAVRLVHAIHTVHLEPPYQPDAPMNSLWARWFTRRGALRRRAVAHRGQRADVEQRFGASPVHVVVPHAVPAAASVGPAVDRDPRSGRHAEPPRPRQAHRSCHPRVRDGRAGTCRRRTLDIYGDGPEHDALQRAHRRARPRRARRAARVAPTIRRSAGRGIRLPLDVRLRGTGARRSPRRSRTAARSSRYDVPYGPREIARAGRRDGSSPTATWTRSRALVAAADRDRGARPARRGGGAGRAAVSPDRAMAALAPAVTTCSLGRRVER